MPQSGDASPKQQLVGPADRAATIPRDVPNLQVGDRVRVYGGYDYQPEWLAANPEGYAGRVVEFIPGQNQLPAPVIELDEELVLPAGAGAVTLEPTGRLRHRAFTSSYVRNGRRREDGKTVPRAPV
jgi:hypothetical protein